MRTNLLIHMYVYNVYILTEYRAHEYLYTKAPETLYYKQNINLKKTAFATYMVRQSKINYQKF